MTFLRLSKRCTEVFLVMAHLRIDITEGIDV
jgi:hypothetical protein